MLQFEVKTASEIDFRAEDNSSVDMSVENAVVVRGVGGITSNQIDQIIVIDRVEYEALESRPSTTLYLLRG